MILTPHSKRSKNRTLQLHPLLVVDGISSIFCDGCSPAARRTFTTRGTRRLMVPLRGVPSESPHLETFKALGTQCLIPEWYSPHDVRPFVCRSFTLYPILDPCALFYHAPCLPLSPLLNEPSLR